VFSGSRQTPYGEEDAPDPKGFYASCKRQTEQALLSEPSGRLVIRTSVLYGYHPGKQNFVSWLVKEAKAGKPLKIVADQKSCPTLANDLANAILSLLEKNCEGLFHATGSECIGRYEFALKIAEVFSLDKKLLAKVATADLKQKAPRPLNSCLLISKLTSKTGVKMRNAKEGLLAMKKEMDEGAP
jgi:dTDP-4-dehydrorhamnose reductase